MIDTKIMVETRKVSNEYDIIMENTLQRICNSMNNGVLLGWIEKSEEKAN